jgi:hypothetical protein
MSKAADDDRQEHAEEAERLRLLPPAVQRQLIAEQEAIAGNRKVPKRDRDFARERADTLTRLLFPPKKKRK